MGVFSETEAQNGGLPDITVKKNSQLLWNLCHTLKDQAAPKQHR